MISSYDRNAVRPLAGTLWAWEPESAPALIRVTSVRWNGEEWYVGTMTLAEYVLPGSLGREVWNDLSRFWEACHRVLAQPGPQGGQTRHGAPRADERDVASIQDASS